MQIRSHGITKDPTKFIHKPAGPWIYEQQLLGFNYRMSDIHAALGLSQLKRLDLIVQERNRIYCIYKNLFSDLPLSLLTIPDGVYSALHLAIIQLHDKCAALHKNLFSSLRESGIGVQLHYSPVHLQPYYRTLGFKLGQYPNAELYAHSSISIPLYPGLSSSEIDRVNEVLRHSIINL
jgi:dTDP-4-amino-4,6-dideoxygalactose transaminase